MVKKLLKASDCASSKQTWQLLRPGFANPYLMFARFGFAWAVAVVMNL
jgi:hypothetical protein